MAINPRWKSGKRRQYQARFRAMGLPCALCGRDIDYSAPYYVEDEQGHKHINPLAFVIDEKIPVSKWQEGGYSSPAACASDFSNLQPCHAICNARKGNKINFTSIQAKGRRRELQQQENRRKPIFLDGNW